MKEKTLILLGLLLLLGRASALNCSNVTLVFEVNETSLFCDDTNTTITLGVFPQVNVTLGYGNSTTAWNTTVFAPAYPFIGQSIYFHWADYGVSPLLSYSNATLGLYVYNTPAANCANQTINQTVFVNVSVPNNATCTNTTIYQNQTVLQPVAKAYNLSLVLAPGTSWSLNEANISIYAQNYSCTTAITSFVPANCSQKVQFEQNGETLWLCWDNVTRVSDVCGQGAVMSGDWLGCMKRYTSTCQAQLDSANAQHTADQNTITGYTTGEKYVQTYSERDDKYALYALIGIGAVCVVITLAVHTKRSAKTQSLVDEEEARREQDRREEERKKQRRHLNDIKEGVHDTA